jgi:predicted amidohydrolase YtcJ
MKLRTCLPVAVGLIGLWMCAAKAALAATADPCSWSRDVQLKNGKIVTMDGKNSIVNEVTIQDGKFISIGKVPNQKLNPCTKVIDLKGRTVVPGLIDNHNHFISLGLRPGYDVRLETAWTISEIQDRIRARIKTTPLGAFITATAGWSTKQLAEKRMPTMAELDAAAPSNPVFMYPTGPGGAAMNGLGKKFFEGKGLKITPEGTLAEGTTISDAIGALQSVQTFEDEKRGAMDAQAYSVSVGLTVNVDQGFNFLRGTSDLQDSAVSGPGIETFSPWTFYDSFLALDRENKLTARLRVFHYAVDTSMDIPIIRERLLNNFPNFGDDMLRFSGVGERVVSPPPLPPGTPQGGGAGGQSRPRPNEEEALQFVAKQGWTYSEHSTTLASDMLITSVYENVNRVTPIVGLHWSIGHVNKIDLPTINRLKDIGAGVEAHGWAYMNGSGPAAGPPFRMILDSGIHVGGGSDAVGVSALDPWLMIYYMVTGKNSAGDLINDGQQITRMEALRLYTANNGWFFDEQDKLGSMEPGKLGDLVVLSADYTDPGKVSDQDIRNIKSVLTVVGGKIVYNDLH